MTSKMAPDVDHVDDENFVINSLSLHNPLLIRKVLPPRLTNPRRMFEDRESPHGASPSYTADCVRPSYLTFKSKCTFRGVSLLKYMY